ncbi:hypothetical protein L2737_04065 [Shewanella electrodiphila]|uniref:DUF1059 domain-containing protein n=1 Tax=Shewanella electrodiphila TaxID=934143 RepID=A0ABT0KKZ1_9GAMM|nr:hypothetical protein [Shewanella electrodiphila]MCL1044508.1 hypothetical protein [Shewanella electrodiphila]
MKTMTCKQLGGACEHEFHAATFEEMKALSKQHGMLIFQQQEPEHMKVMAEMSHLMQDPAAMKAFMEEKQRLFDSITED